MRGPSECAWSDPYACGAAPEGTGNSLSLHDIACHSLPLPAIACDCRLFPAIAGHSLRLPATGGRAGVPEAVSELAHRGPPSATAAGSGCRGPGVELDAGEAACTWQSVHRGVAMVRHGRCPWMQAAEAQESCGGAPGRIGAPAIDAGEHPRPAERGWVSFLRCIPCRSDRCAGCAGVGRGRG